MARPVRRFKGAEFLRQNFEDLDSSSIRLPRIESVTDITNANSRRKLGEKSHQLLKEVAKMAHSVDKMPKNKPAVFSFQNTSSLVLNNSFAYPMKPTAGSRGKKCLKYC